MSKLNKDSMDALFGGLVDQSPTEGQEQNDAKNSPTLSTPTPRESGASRRGRPSGVKKESVTTIVDIDLMNKVRAISKKEGLPITAIFEVGLRMAVQNYEEKNGPVRAYKNKKKDVGDVFDL